MIEKLLQHGQRLDVQVVGRFVEQEHVGLMDERAQQVEPSPLAAAQAADARILHGPRKEKPLQHLRGFDAVAILRADERRFLLDELDQAHLVAQIGAALVVVADLDRLAPQHRARIGRSLPASMSSSVLLPAPLGPRMPMRSPGSRCRST